MESGHLAAPAGRRKEKTALVWRGFQGGARTNLKQ
jgi:hypothetical protein